MTSPEIRRIPWRNHAATVMEQGSANSAEEPPVLATPGSAGSKITKLPARFAGELASACAAGRTGQR